MVTALVSLLTGRPVKAQCGYDGEVTLRGHDKRYRRVVVRFSETAAGTSVLRRRGLLMEIRS